MEKKNNLSISLIVPCFNEETNIQKGVLDKIGNFIKEDKRFIEVLIVDDGSSDESTDIIKGKYLRRFPQFKLIENSHQGKAFAIIAGIQEAKGEYVMFTDIDLATPIEEAETLIEKAEMGAEISIGSRNTQRAGAPFLRKLMAVGFIWVRNFIIGLKGIKDTQCGFKMFQREVALKVIDKLTVFKKKRSLKNSSVSAGFDLEFLFIASKLGYNIKESPVRWRHVETKNVTFIKDALETLKDIAKIKIADLHKKYD